MWLRGFCGCARVSSNYTVWWSVAGKICTQIHTLVAFYDENPTDGRHYRFALPQTFLLILGFCYFHTRPLALTHSFPFRIGALNLLLKCVLNGLLTRCSCNPRFALCMEISAQKSSLTRIQKLLFADAPASAINSAEWKTETRERRAQNA